MSFRFVHPREKMEQSTEAINAKVAAIEEAEREAQRDRQQFLKERARDERRMERSNRVKFWKAHHQSETMILESHSKINGEMKAQTLKQTFEEDEEDEDQQQGTQKMTRQADEKDRNTQEKKQIYQTKEKEEETGRRRERIREQVQQAEQYQSVMEDEHTTEEERRNFRDKRTSTLQTERDEMQTGNDFAKIDDVRRRENKETRTTERVEEELKITKQGRNQFQEENTTLALEQTQIETEERKVSGLQRKFEETKQTIGNDEMKRNGMLAEVKELKKRTEERWMFEKRQNIERTATDWLSTDEADETLSPSVLAETIALVEGRFKMRPSVKDTTTLRHDHSMCFLPWVCFGETPEDSQGTGKARPVKDASSQAGESFDELELMKLQRTNTNDQTDSFKDEVPFREGIQNSSKSLMLTEEEFAGDRFEESFDDEHAHVTNTAASSTELIQGRRLHARFENLHEASFLGDLRWVARFEPNRCEPNRSTYRQRLPKVC